MHFKVSKRIVGLLLIYNYLVFIAFAALYRIIDFEKHFEVPSNFVHDLDHVGYFAFMITCQIFGTNIIPKTTFGRAIVSVHAALSWVLSIVFLAPWLALRN